MNISTYIFLVILLTIILIMLSSKKQQKQCRYKYLPHLYLHDILKDCETGEVMACPMACKEFNVFKQKCVKSTRSHQFCAIHNITTSNHPHPFKCDVFFMCAGNTTVELACSSGLCFNKEANRCVIKGSHSENCTTPCIEECVDCCEK